MNGAILLTKLSQYDNEKFDLFKIYVDATKRNFNEIEAEFDTCIKDIKFLSDVQLDFEWLTNSAVRLNTTRRDVRMLCDDVCMILGSRISDLCKNKCFITSPSKFEDYCPYPKDSFVVYGKVDNEDTIKKLMLNGEHIKIVDTKLETTPYYNIYCSQLILV